MTNEKFPVSSPPHPLKSSLFEVPEAVIESPPQSKTEPIADMSHNDSVLRAVSGAFHFADSKYQQQTFIN